MRLLVGVIVIGLFLRLYHVTYPLGDLHSWRQADTAAVARGLKSYGANLWLPVCQTEQLHIGKQGETCRVPLLNPQIDSFVTIDGKATWMDGRAHTNDTRNHFAEFPLYQAIVAQLAMFLESFPGVINGFLWVEHALESLSIYFDPPDNIEVMKEINYQRNMTFGMKVDSVILSGRLVSIISGLMSVLFLYLLSKRYFNRYVALVCATIYCFLPYSVFWSRAVLPDSLMVMLCLAGLYTLHRMIDAVNTKRRYLWAGLTVIFLSLALLLKVFVLFLLLPIVWILFEKYRWGMLKRWKLWLMALLILLPFGFWRWWIHSDELRLAGIPASNWLFNGSGVRLKPAWWYWLFQTRLDHFMFNFMGLGFAMIAGFMWKDVIIRLSNREISKPVLFWIFSLVSCFIYLVVFATGNLQHEYYQLPIVPFVSIFVGLGVGYVWVMRTGMGTYLRRGVVLGLIGLMWMFGLHKVLDWYGVRNPSYVLAGQRADLVLPKDAMVVADFGGDTTMLYYVNRPGWSIVEFSFEELVAKGATHYISAFRSDGVNELSKKYTIVEETSEYVILDLQNKTETVL